MDGSYQRNKGGGAEGGGGRGEGRREGRGGGTGITEHCNNVALNSSDIF